MKRILLCSMMALIASYTFAQKNAIDTYFSDYLNAPMFEKMSVNSQTFKSFQEVKANTSDEQRVLDAMSKIEGIMVLSSKEKTKGLGYYSDAMQKLGTDQAYQDLMQVTHESANVRLLIREDETGIQEFVMVVGESNHFVLASIYGAIDLKSISRLGKIMQEEKEEWFKLFKHLEEDAIVFDQNAKIETAKTYLDDLALNIYPNPARDHINIASENGKDATLDIHFYSLMGQPLKQVGQVPLPYRLELTQIPAGTYFVRLTDQDGQFRNFRIVKP